ncbi:MAG: UDP-N-acetylmuramoyl-L-alanine--D-glutamate ligase [Ignavibacteria bacterium]
MNIKNDIINKKITVLGAGRSGIGIAKLLTRNKAAVFVSDSSPKEKLMYFDEKVFQNYSIDYEIGRNSDKIYDSEIFVVSPGISPNSDVLKKAVKKNIKILSEVEVSSYFCEVPTIAITGTNGKTTTTELTGAILREAGYDVYICGNVGLAFSEIIPKLSSDSVVVIEVSSFQLEYTVDFKPRVAMILNITPDHIDWHLSFENYVNAKFKICRNQSADDLTIINYDDSILKNEIKNLKSTMGAFSKDKIINDKIAVKCFLEDSEIKYMEESINNIIRKDEILLRGTHNIMNSMAAILAVKKFNVNNDVIKKVLRNFKGVEHRIEFVREIDGVRYYNDSKATNYDSLYVALESFDKNIILIMGGKKGAENFETVDALIKDRVKFICAIGQSCSSISDHYKDIKTVNNFDTLEEAVKFAKNNSVRGDYVLFSPGYKSFDMFNNFEHRGEVFKSIVSTLK